jgi:hypothetical protein
MGAKEAGIAETREERLERRHELESPRDHLKDYQYFHKPRSETSSASEIYATVEAPRKDLCDGQSSHL